jgi:replicative DNA helicase
MSVSASKGKNLKPYYWKESSQRITLDDIQEFKCLPVPQASIIKEDAEYYGIKSEVSREDGETIIATYFPYYDQDDNLTGYKRRDWTKHKDEDYHFTVVGVIRSNSKLFGQHKCNSSGKSLVYVEGEGDVVATRRAMLEALRGTKWEGKIKPNVVGLNLGCGNAVEATAHNEPFIRSFEKLVILMDQDAATEKEKLRGVKKGKEATEDIASFLLANNLFTVRIPAEYKDPREMVEDGKAKELGNLISFETQKFTPEKILSLSNVSVEQLRKKKKTGIPLRHFPVLTHMTGGPIKGELWTSTGPSGSGKTTVSRDIEYDIHEYLRNGLPDGSYNPDTVNRCEKGLPRLDDFIEDERLGVIRLEEDEEETINSLYAMEIGVDGKEFVGDPEKFLTIEEHQEIHGKWIATDRIRVMEHFGSMHIDELINKLKQLVFMNGCRWIMLDHLSMLISGLRTGDERKELDIIMTELAAFCKQHNVFIFAVSHMKRVNVQVPKDKDTDEPLPFFYPVRKEDLRGSAALEQLSWVVLGVEPEELPNRSRGRVRLVSLKNRRGKKLGNADTVWMKEDGTYIPAQDWEVRDGAYWNNGEEVHRFEHTEDYSFEYTGVEKETTVDSF